VSQSRRRRVAAIAGAIAALALLAWWWTRGGGAAGGGDGERGADERARAPAPGRPAMGAAARRALPRPAHDGTTPAPPVIDEVRLEKTEVCQGEENLVTVQAHTPDPEDAAYLHAVVGGAAGMTAPLRRYLNEDGSQPEPGVVTVFSRQNVPATVPIPAYTVKDCMVARIAHVQYRLRPNTDAEFDVGVRIQDVAADAPFEPVAYRWKFGDGQTAESAEPWVIHSYDERPQGDALFESYLIEVEVEGKGGERVLGRSALVLQNTAFANLVFAGTVTLSTLLTPRFPVVDDDGVIRQSVRLWHHRPDPVRIDRIRLRKNFPERREPEWGEASVRAVLGGAEIPPHGVTIAVELDTKAEPGLFSIDYLLEGESAEGLPVRGVFPIMTPSPPPTKDSHIPVRDPVLVAKIKRARELLGQEFVTDEDIWALERQGAFDDLPAGSAAPGATPTYADMPPHPPRPGEPSGDTPLPDGTRLPALGQGGGQQKLGRGAGQPGDR
jgi:hypothetical protein